jgi:hypothetical protein
MEQVRKRKLDYGAQLGFEQKWLREYIGLLPDNNIQLTDDNDDVLILCYLEYRKFGDEWLDPKNYQSWIQLGFNCKVAREMYEHYVNSGWVGDHYDALYFAESNFCDGVQYYIKTKYKEVDLKKIENLLI